QQRRMEGVAPRPVFEHQRWLYSGQRFTKPGTVALDAAEAGPEGVALARHVLVDIKGTVRLRAPIQDLLQVEPAGRGGRFTVLRPETAFDMPSPGVIADHPAVNLERGAVRMQHDSGQHRLALGEHTRSFEMYVFEGAVFAGQLGCRRKRHLDVGGGRDD